MAGAVFPRAHNEYISLPTFEKRQNKRKRKRKNAWGQLEVVSLNDASADWRAVTKEQRVEENSGLILWAEDMSLLSWIHVKAMQCLLNIWKSRLENTGPEYSILFVCLFDGKAHNWQYLGGGGNHSSWCCRTMSNQPVIEPGLAMYKGKCLNQPLIQ